MRTQEEIVARLHAARREDPLFGGDCLYEYLDFDRLRPFLKPEADPPPQKGQTREAIEAEIREYLPFAFEKAHDHRGVSASRSIAHLRDWLWLLGRDDLLVFVENDEHYKNYGSPILKRVAQVYGVAVPPKIEVWADGAPCRPGCNEGCS